jgi:predicted membrane channel-forming protein YqfA (hemolysin III family)
MSELKTWKDLSAEEIKKIIDFRPPKYYRWFYKFYKKYLSVTIVSLFLVIGILGIIYNSVELDFWNVLLGGFFVVMGLGLWALSSHLVKHIYTKKFAKSMGLTLENFNILTAGKAWKE